MTLTEKCNQLIKLAKRATPGEWYDAEDGYVRSKHITPSGISNLPVCQCWGALGINKENASYLAASDPTTVQEICEAYLELKARDAEWVDRYQASQTESDIYKADATVAWSKLEDSKARIQELEAANAELVEALVKADKLYADDRQRTTVIREALAKHRGGG